jgi:hypothetical protein
MPPHVRRQVIPPEAGWVSDDPDPVDLDDEAEEVEPQSLREVEDHALFGR